MFNKLFNHRGHRIYAEETEDKIIEDQASVLCVSSATSVLEIIVGFKHILLFINITRPIKSLPDFCIFEKINGKLTVDN
jgi:hypothetical protein